MGAQTRLIVKAVGVAVLGASLAASAQPLRYGIEDLTEQGQPIGVVQCEARAVNGNGLAAGFEVLPEFRARALSWSGGAASELPLLSGDNSARAVGVTASGDLLGVSDLVEIKMVGHQIRIFHDRKAVVWKPAPGGPGRIVERIADGVTGGAPINLQVAVAQNSAGLMIGWGHVEDPGPGARLFKGWLLDGGQIIDLVDPTRPQAINELGDVVGYTGSGQSKAWLWRGGVGTNLHEHPSITGVTSRAFDIDSSGEIVVGEAQFHISKPEEPTVWERGVPRRLVPEINRPQGVATGINASRDIVGYYDDLDVVGEPFRGVIWTGGERRDLLDLLVRPDGWQVLLPFDINDAGVIVGGGVRGGAIGHGFLMTPLCYADCDGSGVLDVFDFLCFQDLFVAGDPLADCTGEGTLDIFDFLCFQDAFVVGCP